MKKSEVIKSNQEFDELINSGNKVFNNLFSIYYKDSKQSKNRYGIGVSKKIGNAVVRNKLKRQIRYLIQESKLLFQNPKDYIIIVRKGIITASFCEKKDKFNELIEKVNK